MPSTNYFDRRNIFLFIRFWLFYLWRIVINLLLVLLEINVIWRWLKLITWLNRIPIVLNQAFLFIPMWKWVTFSCFMLRSKHSRLRRNLRRLSELSTSFPTLLSYIEVILQIILSHWLLWLNWLLKVRIVRRGNVLGLVPSIFLIVLKQLFVNIYLLHFFIYLIDRTTRFVFNWEISALNSLRRWRVKHLGYWLHEELVFYVLWLSLLLPVKIIRYLIELKDLVIQVLQVVLLVLIRLLIHIY
jgi:hypothetical protein